MTELGSNKYLAGHTYTFTVHAPNSEDGATAYLWGFYTKIGGGWANTTYGTGYFSGGYATVNYTVPQDYQKDFYWEVIAYQSTNSQVRCKRWNTAGPWSQFDTYLLNGQTIEMETYRFDEFEMDRETASFKMLANGVVPTTVDAATVEVIVPWSGDINDYDNSVYNHDTVFCKKGLLPSYAANLGYEVQVVASNPSSPMFQEIRITKPSVGYDVTLFGFRIPTGDDPLGYMWWTTFYIEPVQNMVMNYDPVTGICSGSFSAPLEYYQQYFIQPVAEIYVDTNLKYYYTPGSMDLILSGGILTPIRNVTTGAYYETIQAAIDAAEANHVIEVQPGTYVEQLHVTTENLTIRGAGTDPVVIQSPDVLPLSFTTSAANKPVVFVDGVQEFTLKNVIVDGGNKGNANYRFNGVAFWNAGGTLEDVDVINIMNDPFSGAQHGVGVYAYNNTPLENYTINLNRVLVDNFQKTGVALNGNSESQNLAVNLDYVTTIGEGQTGVTAQNGIQVWDCTGTVNNCNVSGVYYTGSGWTSSGMIVSNCVDMVLTGNIITDSQTAIYSQYNTGVDYISNQISGGCDYGIYDNLSTDLVANQNTITGIPYGMWLSPGATITNNILTGNEYAILLDDGTGYTITGNQFTDNYVHVHNFGADPDVNTLIPTNTYAPTYFIVDQTIYGNGTVLYVDAPLEVIQDNVQQTYSVKASYAGNLRGFDVMLIIPKADFATAPSNFVMGSAFTSPLYVVDQSTDTEWIYVVTGAFLGAGSVTGENVTLFTFDATSTADYNNVPDGCNIQLPLGEVTLRDENNQPIECFDTLDKWILIDNIPPTPVVWEDEITALLHPCRTTPNANNSIDLMWTNPEGAKKIQIWTLSYGDAGTGYTHYPEYDDHSEPSLAAPDPLLGSPQNGWVKFAEIDPPETFPYTLTGMERGYYYITLFAVDEASNISAAPDAPFHRESISYWPGDVNEDGKVMDDDIGLLGAVWGFNSSNEAWNNVIDVGPSTDYARRSRPIPDNKINIEDLMMFAMNYYNTHYEDYHRNFPELNPITVMMATQNNGGQIVVNLELSGNNGFLKGLNMPIAYGSGLQLVSIEQGNIWPEASLLLHTNAEGLVEVSCATLGQNALEGDGNIATLVFNVVGSDTEITLQPMIARSWDNHDIAITYGTTANDDLVNVIPLESYLGSNFPNPFNPSTTIQYGLKEASSVRINVYNSRGQLIRTLIDESKAAGTYRVVWDGKDSNNRSVSSGIYYFRMEAQDYVKTNKGILIK
ncbi:MAG TPA: FlgD immunoglobulin-like domain containing protein [Candidatus Syntrophosphaera sp.]|nr:FlgD immunoglobulin-like domain containing protein [Candidatus Syntrophosphaera sp.]